MTFVKKFSIRLNINKLRYFGFTYLVKLSLLKH